MPNFASPDHFCLLMLLLLIIWSPNLAPPDHFARFICSSSLFSSSRCAPLDNLRSLFRSHFALLYWLVLYIFFHFAFPYHLLSWLTLLTILLFLFCSYSPICFPYLAPLVYFLLLIWTLLTILLPSCGCSRPFWSPHFGFILFNLLIWLLQTIFSSSLSYSSLFALLFSLHFTIFLCSFRSHFALLIWLLPKVVVFLFLGKV